MSVIQDPPGNTQPGPSARTAAAPRQAGLLAVLACAAALMCLLTACTKEPPSSQAVPSQTPSTPMAGATPAPAPPGADSDATDMAPPAAVEAPPAPAEAPSPAAGATPADTELKGNLRERVVLPPFPWPPPPYSASMVIPRHVLLKNMRARDKKTTPQLKDVDGVLHKSLRAAGYELSYFSVDRGFALVSRMERITDTGAPYPNPKLRFDASLKPLEHFSIADYMRALFLAPPGYFRLIVFIVSPVPFAATGKPVSSEEANAWLEHGANLLPASVGALPYSDDYACTALIYEFEKRDTNPQPVELHPGRLSAETHLVMSGIRLGLPQKQPAQ